MSLAERIWRDTWATWSSGGCAVDCVAAISCVLAEHAAKRAEAERELVEAAEQAVSYCRITASVDHKRLREALAAYREVAK